MEGEDGQAEKKLRAVLEDLTISCNRYLNITKGTGAGPGTGKTKLDKERTKLCEREIVRSIIN